MSERTLKMSERTLKMPEKTLKIFGALDILFGSVYLFSFLYVVPPYSDFFKIPVYGLSILLIAAGIIMISTKKAGFWAGVIAGCGLLLTCLILLGLLTSSAAYLYGLYGAFGKGATYVTFFVMSLVVTWFGVLPCFQLWGLLRAPVRSWALGTNSGKAKTTEKALSSKKKAKVDLKSDKSGKKSGDKKKEAEEEKKEAEEEKVKPREKKDKDKDNKDKADKRIDKKSKKEKNTAKQKDQADDPEKNKIPNNVKKDGK